jgi:hypothetical protein
MAPERLKGRTLPCPKCGELVSIPGDPAANGIPEKPSAAVADAVFAGRESVAKELPPPPPAKVVSTPRPPDSPEPVEKRESPPVEKPKTPPPIESLPIALEPIKPAKAPLAIDATKLAPVGIVKPPEEPPKPAAIAPPLPPPAMTIDPPMPKVEPLAPAPALTPPAAKQVVDAPKPLLSVEIAPRLPATTAPPPPPSPSPSNSSPPNSSPPSPPPAVESKPTPAPPARQPEPVPSVPAIALLGEENDFDPTEFALNFDAEAQASPHGHRKAAGVLLLTGLTLLIPTAWPLSQSREIDVLTLPHWVYVLWLLVLLDVAYALLLVQVTHRYSRLTTAGYLMLVAGFWAALAAISWLGRSDHPLLTLLELNEPVVRRAALFLSVVSSAIHGVIACYCGMLGEEE